MEKITYDYSKEQNALVENLISKAENLLSVWEEWIPEGAACDTRKKLQELEDKRSELWQKWVVEFGNAQRMEADRIGEIKLRAAEASAESDEKAAEARKMAAEVQLRMAEAAEEERAELAKA